MKKHVNKINWDNPEEVKAYHQARYSQQKAAANPDTVSPVQDSVENVPVKADIKAYNHDYYEKNKAKLKEQRKQYYAEHKKEYAIRGKKNHSESYKRFKNLPDTDEYKQERKRKIAENAARYYQEHREEILEKKRKRFHDKKNNK